MSPPTRRKTLAALAASALAGCTSFGRTDAHTLGCVVVSNYHDEPHAVGLRIERDGERVHESTRELPPVAREGGTTDGHPEVISSDWERDGRFVIRTRLDDGPWTETALADLSAPDGSNCLDVEKRVHAPDGDGARLGTLVSDCGGAFCAGSDDRSQ